MNRPDEDLGRLAADALRTRHFMTRDVLHAHPDEPAAEVRAWMDANGFAVVPVDERPVHRMIRREHLADRTGPAGPIAEPIQLPHLVSADLPLDDAMPHLVAHRWFFVLEGQRVVGIVTRSDLRRPAVTQWVLSHLLVLERGLDHLLGSYGGLRPHPGPRSFYQVVEDVAVCAPLRADLGLTGAADARRRLHPLRNLRNHLAHGRSLLDHAPTVADAVAAAAEAVRICRQVWALLDDRPQVWDAYLASTLVTDDGPLTGPDAGPLPAPLHVLTACNPHEQRLDAADNRRRNAHLRDLLTARGLSPVPVRAAAPDGTWEEPGFAVAGLPLPDALAIAHRFGQRALYALTDDQLQVVDLQGRVRGTRPRRG